MLKATIWELVQRIISRADSRAPSPTPSNRLACLHAQQLLSCMTHSLFSTPGFLDGMHPLFLCDTCNGMRVLEAQVLHDPPA